MFCESKFELLHESEAFVLACELRKENAKLREALNSANRKKEDLQLQVISLSNDLKELKRGQSQVLLGNQRLMKDLWKGVLKRDKIIQNLRQSTSESLAKLDCLAGKSQKNRVVRVILNKHFPNTEDYKGRSKTPSFVTALTNLVSDLVKLHKTAKTPMLDTMESSKILRSDLFYNNCSLCCANDEKVTLESFLDGSGSFILNMS